MNNLKIVEFKEQLAGVINKCDLPVLVKQMTISELLGQLTLVAANEIEAERRLQEGVNKDGQSIQPDSMAKST